MTIDYNQDYMEEVLREIGLSEKEARYYLLLLKQGDKTATELAELTDEKRTNAYMILEGLLQAGLVTVSKETGRGVYRPADPVELRKLLETEQRRQRQANMSLTAVLPELRSLYALSSDRVGVVQLSGLHGFETMLDDMLRSRTEILLVASDAPTTPEIWDKLKMSLEIRKVAGIKTRTIYHLNEAEDGESMRAAFAERGMEMRFLGDRPFPGELTIYEDNSIFISYEPSLSMTVITNHSIAETNRLLFEELWDKAN